MGQVLRFELSQQLGGTGLGRGECPGELGLGQRAEPGQQHPGEVKPRVRALARKLAREDFGGAGRAGDVAGGIVERGKQAFPGVRCGPPK